MTEKQTKYNTDYQRRKRLKNKKCAICNEQAFARILLTQELRCAKHLVAPLKEELTKQIPKEKQPSQQPTQNAPSAANQAQQAASSAQVAAT